MISIIDNDNNLIVGLADNLVLAHDVVNSLGLKNYKFLQELNMNYCSRICIVNDEYVYNNKEFWTTSAFPMMSAFSAYDVRDFMNETVSYDDFVNEAQMNTTRIQQVQNISNQIQYNREIGGEFIDLFREDCIKSDTTGMTESSILTKVADMIPMLLTGSFASAEQYIQEALIPNPNNFFTVERLTKYMNMLSAADIITYL